MKMTQPWRSDSIYHEWALQHSKRPCAAPSPLTTPSTGPWLQGLPSQFINLYGLDATGATHDNPYQIAASALAQTLDTDFYYSTILDSFSFLNDMQPGYKLLLERKDPRALLLLAFWYAKICQSGLWWIHQRAALECRAICIYLERYHRHESEIETLLQYLRKVFGIIEDTTGEEGTEMSRDVLTAYGQIGETVSYR